MAGPFEHERLASAYLRDKVVSREGDRGIYKIATWRNKPIIHYAHACEMGSLTEKGLQLLKKNGIEDLYDREIPGEEFRTEEKE